MRNICKCDRCGAIVNFSDAHVVSMRSAKDMTVQKAWDLCNKCLAQVVTLIQNPTYEAIEIIDPFDLGKEQ